jgi:hypothetical protein
MSTTGGEPQPAREILVRRHLRVGWWALLSFLTMGIALETLHGFKIGFYLDATNHTRRLLWTLAHAHGALLALVNIGFALSVRALPGETRPWSRRASASLVGATVCLPGGFFLGGLFFWGGDPGIGVALVPVGGFLLLFAVLLIARGVHEATRG